MIVSFDCTCGNKDPKKAKFYDGALGYSAIICKVCGTTYDFDLDGKPRVNPPDEWSLNYVGLKVDKIKLTKADYVEAMRVKEELKVAKIREFFK